MNNATPVQKLLLVVGAVVILGGLVCVVLGFVGFAQADPANGGDSSMALFAAGGFAAVIGFGIVAFTRAAILTRGGAYSRITIEHGVPRGGEFCSSCGQPVAPSARFCDACGHAVA
ncbi:hypothetical protein GCM10027062_22330 [Nocardioides hungaricus]